MKAEIFLCACWYSTCYREGILILETQQSSDTTYRIYDYERTDNKGNQRELHLAQSKAVINLLRLRPYNTQTRGGKGKHIRNLFQ